MCSRNAKVGKENDKEHYQTKYTQKNQTFYIWLIEFSLESHKYNARTLG